MKKLHPTPSSGFTLLELILVLVFVGFFTTGVSYHFSQVKGRLLLRQTSKEVQQLIQKHESMAILSGRRQILEFTPLEIFQLPESTPGVRRLILRLPRTLHFKDVRFGNVSAANNQLFLRPTRSLSPGSLIIASDNNHTCKLTISLWGAIRENCQ